MNNSYFCLQIFFILLNFIDCQFRRHFLIITITAHTYIYFLFSFSSKFILPS